MTLRIEQISRGEQTILKLVGHLRSEDLPELEAQLKSIRTRLLFDLDELTLVDAESVKFLKASEQAGVQLINCPLYVASWMKKERPG